MEIETFVTFSSCSSPKEIKLEGRLHLVKNDSKNVIGNNFGHVGIIACHPHPKLGGNLYNNVVKAVVKSFQDESFSTLRFNTRGIGRSMGSSSWTGVDEICDIKGALKFMADQNEIKEIVYIGYSFGAAVGFAAIHDILVNDNSDEFESVKDKLKVSVAVSYPKGLSTSCMFYKLYTMLDNPLPKLFVIGANDNFTSISTVKDLMEGISQPKEFEIINGPDHFWNGREEDLVDVLLPFVKKYVSLKPAEIAETTKMTNEERK